MSIWLAWLIALVAFNVGFIIGAWWRAIYADVPLVEVNPSLPADDIYGRGKILNVMEAKYGEMAKAQKALMEGKI